MKNIRNFCVIAHIDHGKSTLSDRLIQTCGGLSEREMDEQVLDTMDLERERGITIKSQSVTLTYKSKSGKEYQLNFIDTPGHVDFSYEVSRSLAACEGALLVVDAAQSVEAQTLAVCYSAIEQDLEVIPVLNKIDLPQAEPERVINDIEEIIGIPATDSLRVSAKSGIGIDDLLEQIVAEVPPPEGDPEAPLQALIIDSWFDNYLGVVSLVRIVNGKLHKNDKIRLMSTRDTHLVDHLGIYTPKRFDKDCLSAGEVGFIIAGIKDVHGAPVGDTITLDKTPAESALAGFEKVQPQVYAGLFPVTTEEYEEFREALDKLSLNDASLVYEPENSTALGFGFRCGFLGLLHMEIIQQRLEREYDLTIITTSPSVAYQVELMSGEKMMIDSPSKMPEVNHIKTTYEPIVQVNVLVPSEHVGAVMKLAFERRGNLKKQESKERHTTMEFHIPMSEVILDFFDKLKSATRGYASLDYSFSHYQEANLAKVDVLLNGEKIDALALLTHRDQAEYKGRLLIKAMKKLIPQQMYEVAIQAAIGSKIIARETVRALRKNVTAKCYGGDISRKRKLLEKQKKGKKRMKEFGNVSVPKEAFVAVLKTDEE